MLFSPSHLRPICRATLVVLALFFAPKIHAGDPDLVLHSIRTTHFEISFDHKLTAMGQQIATIAEEAYQTVTDLFRWQVEGRIRVHIEDSQDSANGLASATPAPYILLYAIPPEIDSSLQHHDDWLRTLFIHEFTHVVHLQMQHKIPRVINRVFGDIYLINSMQPRWFVEGLAVLMETEQTSKGRIRSAYYPMILRTHALEDQLQTLDQASNITTDYPRGTADYAYGALFLDWLKRRFGMERLVELAHAYASEPIPYGLNRLFLRITQESLIDLYAQWQRELRQEAEAHRTAWQQRGGMSSTPITVNGETKGRPIFTPAGDRIILPMADAAERPGIFSMRLDGTDVQRIALTSGSVTVSSTDDGTLYYTRTAPVKNVYRFSDLFVANPDEHSVRRLTHGLRIRDMAASPSGETLAAVLHDEIGSRLVLLDAHGRIQQTLNGPTPDIYYTPAFSPDGKYLALAVRRHHHVNLVERALETGVATPLTDDPAIQSWPTYSHDGQWLLYASDHSGTSNIYARHRASGTVRQITNALTAATAPALSQDGRTLAFLYYRTQGWDLHVMDFAPEHAPLQDDIAWQPLESPVTPPAGNYALAPYNPLPSLLPRTWRFDLASAGGHTLMNIDLSMTDAADQHEFSSTFQWDFTQRDPALQLTYTYTGMRPSFFLNFSYAAATQQRGFVVDGVARPWEQRSLGGSAGLSVPVLGVDRNHALTFSYTINATHPASDLQRIEPDPNADMPKVPVNYFRAGLNFGWSFSELWSSPFAISTEKGRAIAASMRLYNPAFGGNQKLLQFSWAWKEYLRAPWHRHHVWALMINGGAYISHPPHQAYFSAGGYPPTDLIQSVIDGTGASLPRLRGYPWNSINGDHYQAFRLEYRFPIWRIERTYHTLPVFFQYISGSVFSDNMFIAFHPFTRDDFYSATGGELILAFSTGYYNPLQLRLGYAKGWMDTGMHEWILVVGGTF